MTDMELLFLFSAAAVTAALTPVVPQCRPSRRCAETLEYMTFVPTPLILSCFSAPRETTMVIPDS